jgi:hypothetical protein
MAQVGAENSTRTAYRPQWIRLDEAETTLLSRGYANPREELTRAVREGRMWKADTGNGVRLSIPRGIETPQPQKNAWRDQPLDFDNSTVLFRVWRHGEPGGIWQRVPIQILSADVDRFWPAFGDDGGRIAGDRALVNEGLAALKTGEAQNPYQAAKLVAPRAKGNSRDADLQRLRKAIAREWQP